MSDKKMHESDWKWLTKTMGHIIGDYGKTLMIVHLLLEEGRIKEAHEWVLGPIVENSMLPESLTAEQREEINAYAMLENTELTWPGATAAEPEDAS